MGKLGIDENNGRIEKYGVPPISPIIHTNSSYIPSNP
jgi:hypothetical protein